MAAPGEAIVTKGETGSEMFFLCRGEAEVESPTGKILLKEGDVFGEIALLMSQPRIATVRAKSICDLFVLDKADFARILRDNPQFAQRVTEIAQKRYKVSLELEQLTQP